MVLLAATLGTELQNLSPVDNEAQAVQTLATAWHNYFKGSSVAGIPALEASLLAAKNAMVGALSGMSQANQAAAKLAAGITAYWGAVIPAAASIWVTVPPIMSATPPPGLAGVAATVSGIFSANTFGKLNLAASATALANALHPVAGLTGIAVLGPPPPGGTPTPIL
jgi:hypothetical protein